MNPTERPRPTSVDTALAAMIDHTLLKPEATPEDIDRLCSEARQYSFASICVNPSFVARCRRLVEDSTVKVCTVIGFPLGATSTGAKVAEAEQAIRHGAHEIDMVLHIGMLKAGNHEYVRDDIAAVVRTAHPSGVIVKVILETSLLTDDQKRIACEIAKAAEADFVKTSTGFSGGGATECDIALMRSTVGSAMGVKASGGIRAREQALAMIKAGATRIGASAGIALVTATQPSPSTTY